MIGIGRVLLLNTAVQKLLLINYEGVMVTLHCQKNWVKPTILDSNDWLKEKAAADDLLKNTASKAMTKDSNSSVT